MREPTEVEQKILTLLIGVDSLLGGDALAESGSQHFIADTWFSGYLPSAIYYDPIA